jgi:hypothetical protein
MKKVFLTVLFIISGFFSHIYCQEDGGYNKKAPDGVTTKKHPLIEKIMKESFSSNGISNKHYTIKNGSIEVSITTTANKSAESTAKKGGSDLKHAGESPLDQLTYWW